MLGGCSGREMASQTGFKHAPNEPAQLETKRSRRRAGGRAAALRRAPSDSDCSGETASLSADSAERAPRAPPPPIRQAKSRSSRRRGSEWEVLEGLKDGQRFEKRPDVFNGYLHKKRKWPLKGWHKRFFVVDGGILVYARSPSDVARGRLHGSVDVGLSVISAKARRRRIDIDADEFIYHLRAKTPDAFRTWLNVLKTHRLYRQHLLTFGARESVPKIHAPLEDLPPPETTSQSLSRTESWYSPIGGRRIDSHSTWISSLLRPSSLKTLLPSPPLKKWPRMYLQPNEITSSDKSNKNEVFVIDKPKYKHGSLCSMNCLAKVRETTERFEAKKNSEAKRANQKENGNAEIQVHSTNPDTREKINSLNASKNIRQIYPKEPALNNKVTNNNKKHISESSNTVVTETEPIVYCFTHKPRSHSTNTEQPQLKRSKKSTNMVRYRNSNMEPTLKKPFSKCMLLGKYKLKVSRQSDAKPARIDLATNHDISELSKCEEKVIVKEENSAEVYRMTDKLIKTVFENYKKSDTGSCEDHLKSFIDQVITELYCFSCEHSDGHPVKTLFKCLLEYWIRTVSLENLNGKIPLSCEVKSVGNPSHGRFMKDQNTSSLSIPNISKETQFEGLNIGLIKKKSQNSMKTFDLRMPGQVDVVSKDRDRRVQELERVLNNTVYYCNNINRTGVEDEDLKMTERLIENFDKKSLGITPASHLHRDQKDTSEVTETEKTMDNFIKNVSKPLDMSRDIFNVLKILNNANSHCCLSAHTSKVLKPNTNKCNVLTECVLQKTSKCVMTQVSMRINRHEQPETVTDSGQIYLNDVLNKICVESSNDCSYLGSDKIATDAIFNYRRINKDKLETLSFNNSDENAALKKNNFVVYLSKYNLERTSDEHPMIRKMMSVAYSIENGSSTFDHHVSRPLKCAPDIWQTNINYVSNSDEIFKNIFGTSKYFPNNCLDHDIPEKKFGITQFISSSGATSKRYSNILYDDNFPSLSSDNNREDQAENTSKLFEGPQFPINDITSYNMYVKNFRDSPKMISNVASTKCKHIPKRTVLPEKVNEDAVILLLNRLSTLTECIPFLHRDINRLYRGLYKDFGQSFEEFRFIDETIKSKLKKETGTDVNKPTNKVDAVTNTMSFISLLKNIAHAYEKLHNQTKLNNVELEASTHSQLHLTQNVSHKRSHKAVPNQNSYRKVCTRDIDTNTSTKPKELRSGNRLGMPVTLKKKSPIRKIKVPVKNRRNVNIIKDLPMLPLKLSKSHDINKVMFEDKLTECNVYKLFVSNRFRVNCSNSVIESKAKFKSSGDLKTIYRRSSDRSFFSGY